VSPATGGGRRSLDGTRSFDYSSQLMPPRMLKESLVFLYLLLLVNQIRDSSRVFQEAGVLPYQVSFDVETDE
jgi:hypothetical protein